MDDFEASVTEFILGLLDLAGIDDEPSYTRSRIINKSEETQTILMGADYYDDEYITKKLLTILGDADQYDTLMERKAAEEAQRMLKNRQPRKQGQQKRQQPLRRQQRHRLQVWLLPSRNCSPR